MYEKTALDLINFIDKSPTCFHVAKNMKDILLQAGFEELKESCTWDLKKGGKYFVTRNLSAIIAFCLPEKDFVSFNIAASHSDSPCFKIKDDPIIADKDGYARLNVETYGGMLLYPWFDRPLSIAGRVIVKENGEIHTKLINIDKDLLMIPNLAIHMDRAANDGHKISVQKEMLPILCEAKDSDDFLQLIGDEIGVQKEDILSHDLFLYPRQKGTIWGANREFIGCSRIDDQECGFSSLQGILNCKVKDSVAVHCVFDNEEIGSNTKQGADSTFLEDVLVRISNAYGKTNEEFKAAISSSFMISADNAHGIHPSYKEKADLINRPYLNKGIVIKTNGKMLYVTDALSSAVMKTICEMAKVPYQMFANHSDIRGGSTLGSISSSHISINAVDIGLAQLAMHSPYECAGVKDVTYLIEAFKTFFNSTITIPEDGTVSIK